MIVLWTQVYKCFTVLNLRFWLMGSVTVAQGGPKMAQNRGGIETNTVGQCLKFLGVLGTQLIFREVTVLCHTACVVSVSMDKDGMAQ